MKRNVLILFSLLVLFSFKVLADPPEKIILSYNSANKTLKVIVEHKVKDPTKHHIESIKITLNGKEITKKKYKSQTSIAGEEDSFVLSNVKAGDELKVTAACNFGGNLNKKLEIKK